MKSQPRHMRAGACSKIVCPTCRVGRLASEPAAAMEIRCTWCGASFSVVDAWDVPRIALTAHALPV